ncbi:hypothetical protein [Vulcanisaeta distributa]|nr:hypothetical protein [Vulcanisaeta distributa]
MSLIDLVMISLVKAAFIIVGIVILILAMWLSYDGNVWHAIISDFGVFLLIMGFVMLFTPGSSYVTPAGPIVGSGGTLMAIGLQEYFRAVSTSPDLRIEIVQDKPILNTFPDLCGTNRPAQQNAVGYLRLRVRNIGRGAAKNCVAQVRASLSGSAGCSLSPDYNDWVDLVWAGNRDRVDINPNDVRIFNLIVMPLDNGSKPFYANNLNMATVCGGSPPYAWFARPDVFLLGCLNRVQDCLTKCTYEVEVQVTCENARAEPVRLRLTIGDDWKSTSIQEVK